MNKTFVITVILLITTTALSSLPIPPAQAAAVTWSCTIHVNETSGCRDTVVFGEAPDATDGPPADTHDVAKPPSPFQPFIRAYLKDNLPSPYTYLWEDYRHPGTTKTWNLTITWNPADEESPTQATLTWDPTDFQHSEYTNVTLCNKTLAPLQNMRTTTSYSFNYPATTKQLFKILCTQGSTPPSGGDGQGSPPSENIPPIATITTSATTAFVNDSITFNGTQSHDPDGHLISWLWDFGDGTTATQATCTHAYHLIGHYTVNLTVTDDGGDPDTATTLITIIKTNHPPTPPSLTGPTQGKKDTKYTFTIASTDPEGDSIQYTVQWGDGARNISGFLPNGSVFTASHAWSRAGSYTIVAMAKDNTTASEQYSSKIFINVTFVGILGFFYDMDNDGFYDTFHSNYTETDTVLQRLTNGDYQFTVGITHYLYDPITGSLINQGETTNTFTGVPWFFISVIILVIGIIFLIAYSYWKGYF